VAFFPKADHSIVQIGPEKTQEPTPLTSITIGETSTQIGFWSSKSLGKCSDQNVTRMSMTASEAVNLTYTDNSVTTGAVTVYAVRVKF